MAILDKKNVENIMPLTQLQEGLLFHYLKDNNKNLYCVQLLIEIEGLVDVDRFKAAWEKVVEGNDVLRTVYRWEKLKNPVQIILKKSDLNFNFYDLSSSENLESQLDIVKRKDFEKGFDLSEIPFRITLCKLGRSKFSLLICNHHIVYDGWSNGILLKEFLDYYSELFSGKEIKIQKKTPFWKYINLNKKYSEEGEIFWKDYLKDFESNNVFKLKNNTYYKEDKINNVNLTISADRVARIKQFCESNKITIADILYSAWGILLSKYSNGCDIVFGTTVSGRNIKLNGVGKMVGLFINTIPFRIKISPDQPLISIIKKSSNSTIERSLHENIPLRNILDYTGHNEDELLESIFVIENYPLDKRNLQLNEGLSFKEFSIHESTNYKLTISALMSDDIVINFKYFNSKFEKKYIEGIGNHYNNTLSAIISDDRLNIKDINLLSTSEKQQLLYAFNNTRFEYPKDRTLHGWFEYQVRKTPYRVALQKGGKYLTYSELNKRSNQLALYCRGKGLTRESKVGLLTDHSLDSIIGMLGILKSGGCYVPIDKSYPEDRIRYIIEDASIDLLLLSKKDLGTFKNLCICTSLDDKTIYKEPGINLASINTPSDLCYIIYTSGSTGNPKGVMVEHRNVVSYIFSFQQEFNLTGNDIVMQQASISFDTFVEEAYPILMQGGQLSIFEKSEILDLDKLKKLILNYHITVISCSPLLLNEINSIPSVALQNVRLFISGGDELRSSYMDNLIKFSKVYNTYGPTESTVCSLYYECTRDDVGNIPIGKPVKNDHVFILGKHLELLPIGVPGELCISGSGLSRGYLNNEKLTNEKFIDHPFKEGEKLYRTGDLARWLPDGNIEFLGRIDYQVKIRGFRIELGEIENVLLKHSEIKECTVLVREENGDKYLCAYIVVKGEFQAEEIRTYISAELPGYMVPSYFVELTELPLTTSGKVNRKALPAPEIKTNKGYVAPSNDIETKLVGIWSDILKLSIDVISINVSFFSIGGHSLNATQLSGRIHKDLGIEFPLGDIFVHTTIQAQAKEIELKKKVTFISIPKSKLKAHYKLSSAQKRLFLLQQLNLKSTTYNMPYLMPVDYMLKLNEIKEIFTKLIYRHEAFRTCFKLINDEPVQQIQDEVEFDIKEFTIKQNEVQEFQKSFIKAFELDKAPLFRVAKLNIEGSGSALMIDLHHIICDGISHNILENEFTKLVNGEDIPELSIHYKDYSEWQNSKEFKNKLKGQEKYWLAKCNEEISIVDIPTDFKRPRIKSNEGTCKYFSISEKETLELRKIMGEEGVTMYMLTLAIFKILLSRLSGQEDIVIGTPVAGRNHIELEGIVGMFVNTLLVRSRIDGELSFKSFLQELKQEVVSCFENQDYPFENLVEKLEVNRDTSRNPIFDISFNMLHELNEDESVFELENKGHFDAASKFDLSLNVLDTKKQVIFSLHYCKDLFKPQTIDTYIEFFKRLISELIKNIDTPILNLSILNDLEKQKILNTFNENSSDYPIKTTLIELFEKQVSANPEEIALKYEDGSYTYSKLNKWSNQLGYFLQRKGVSLDTVVGIVMDKSPEMILAILGIQKAGGAYLPIDYTYPDERIKLIAKESKIKFILGNGVKRFSFPEVEFIELNTELLSNEESGNLKLKISANNLAYVIFTSGSTGVPRGVAVEHRNAVNAVIWYRDKYKIKKHSNILQTTNYTFDPSVLQIFASLLSGAILHLLNQDQLLNQAYLVNYVNNNNIKLLHFVPSLLQELFFNIPKVRCLERVISGGESLPVSLKDKLIDKGYEVFNHYGPSETAIVSISGKCEKDIDTIGKPLYNTQIYILDKYKQPVPVNIKGEVYIGGEGVARGYLYKEELTEKLFIDNPFHGGRMYKTGDSAKWLPDGRVEFLGRIDHQVKIRGYRIELGEIENALRQHQNIKECVVSLKGTENDKFLCAYIVHNKKINEKEYVDFLLRTLPDYMVPAYFIELDKIPLTNNGKINRIALPEPEKRKENEITPASTEDEIRLTSIWSEVLNIDKGIIGIDSNFFSVGGHSLKAVKLCGKIIKEFGLEFSLQDVFSYPTIREQVLQLENKNKKQFSSIPKAVNKANYPLSSAQKRLFLLQQLDLDSTAYNMPFTIPLLNKTDKGILENIFTSIIDRHESLRTGFYFDNDTPIQKIHNHVDFKIDEISFGDINITDPLDLFIKPFDLNKPPLLRVCYVNQQNGNGYLMVDIHHIISDGISLAIIKNEFDALINGHSLKDVKIQYRDFSEWQNCNEQITKIEEQEAYWLKKFEEEIPVLNLPCDYPRPQIQGSNGANLHFIFTEDEVLSMRQMLDKSGLTLSMTGLAAFALLISRLSNQDDIVIGTPVAGRNHPDLQSVVGMFVNTIALKYEVHNNEIVGEFLSRLKDGTIQSYNNQEYPFEDLVEKVTFKRDTSRNPMFDVMYDFLNDYDYRGNIENINEGEYQHKVSTAKFDLSLTLAESNESVLCSLEYNTELFNADTIERYMNYYRAIIKQLPYVLDSCVHDLDILDTDEKEELLYKFNGTKVEFPDDKLTFQLFEDIVQNNADSVALQLNDEQVTYGELNRLANKLASTLRKLGVKPNETVAIYGNRNIETIYALLGILKSGAAFLPIDSTVGGGRCDLILEESNSNILITTKELSKDLKFKGRILLTEDESIFSSEEENLLCVNKSTDLAYVIYTSGSTGKPKGVMIEHRNYLNANFAWRKEYNLEYKRLNSLQVAGLGFDVFAGDIARSLINGGKLVICPNDTRIDFPKFLKLLINQNINLFESTPALVVPLLDYAFENGFKLKDLDLIVIGSDSLSIADYSRLMKQFGKNQRIINSYGVTEATIDTSYYEESNPNNDLKILPIGKPMPNMYFYILNNLKLQPIGVVGELCIGGAGVGRGYFNNKGLTESKFVPNPYEEGSLYKTGDLARWLPDGNVEFLGRMDYQVKIRGYRIEVGEIENVLLKHDQVKECVVIDREEKEDKYLCGYIVFKGKFSEEEIRIYLSSVLPDYMIPSYFVELDELPLTINGKVNRKALPAPETKANEGYEAPSNETEKTLVEIWSNLLNIQKEDLSVNSNFFTVGGHSLRATVLAGKISNEFTVDFSLREVFLFGTIKEQGVQIDKREGLTKYTQIPKAKVKPYYPLSSAQKRLYLLQQMNLDSTVYNMPYVFNKNLEIGKNKIVSIFNKLIQRHESFRTSFCIYDEKPVQVVHKTVPFEIEEIKIDSIWEEGMERRYIKPFDLTKAPLFKATIINDLNNEKIVLIDVHHIICDGISHAILEKEFESLLINKKLEPLKLQYKDYSEWQSSINQHPSIKEQENYWLSKFLGEIPAINLPADFQRPAVQSNDGCTVSFLIDKSQTKQIRKLAEKQGVTLYMSILAALKILLSKLSGEEDIIIGSPIAGRRHVDLENVVGMFVNTLAIRTNVKVDITIAEFLQSIKSEVLNSFENQDYQFEDLVEKVTKKRDISRNPIFDVLFNLLSKETHGGSLSNFKSKLGKHQKGVARFDLSLIVADFNEELLCYFEYSTSLFTAQTIERFIGYFRKIITLISSNANHIISEIEIIDEKEKNKLLHELNNTEVKYSKSKTVLHLFEEQCKQRADAIAFMYEDKSITYKKLDQKTNQISNALRRKGVGKGAIVGISMDKSVELIVAILGVLKSGGAYLPMDPDYPQERTNLIVESCDIHTLLVDRQVSFTKTINTVHIDNILNTEICDRNYNLPNPHDLAYVIFTSGSTGKPKGVMIEHISLSNFVVAIKNETPFVAGDTLLSLTTISFDIFALELFMPLTSGTKMILGSSKDQLDIEAVTRKIKYENVNILQLTPSGMQLMLSGGLGREHIQNFKYIMLGGEPLPQALLNKLQKETSANIYNLYGPTETTIWSAIKEVTNDEQITIGKPLANTQLYVLDQALNLTAQGSVGELFIGGDGLARGYYNDKSLTDERFIQNPYKSGSKIYKTGDLVRWLPDGNLEFVGRADTQVKIRGFRVELLEIEYVLQNHDDIFEGVVTCIGNDSDKFLCAYIVTASDANEDSIKAYMRERLPDYMVPSYFVVLDKLPKTDNGKINRKELPLPDIDLKEDYTEPSNNIERKLQELWSEVISFELDKISTSKSIFELGGHSLKAMLLAGRIQKEFEIEFTLHDVFISATIQEQAKLINKRGEQKTTVIPKASGSSYYQVSSAQKRLFLLQQMNQDSTAYNISDVIALPASASKEKIEHILNILIDRHESLRTSFNLKNDTPVQIVHDSIGFAIDEMHIKTEEENKLVNEFIKPFDLNNAPLLRATYVNNDNKESFLLLDIHHIITDGMSMSVLKDEFNSLLQGELLKPVKLQYKDYCQWLNSSEQQVKINKQSDYWLRKFEGEIPVLDLPLDYIRPQIRSHEGANVKCNLNQEVTTKLRTFIKQNNSTLFISLLTVFNILLAKLSRQKDIVIGTPIAGRNNADLAKTVGMFINTLALRNQVKQDDTLISLIKRIKKETIDAFKNQDYQFESLVENLSVQRDTSRNPIFDVLFNLVNYGDKVEGNQRIKFEEQSKFDLTLIAVDKRDNIQLQITYCTRLFKKETIERYLSYLQKIINSLIELPTLCVSDIDILGDEEKAKLLSDFNTQEIAYPEKSIPELFKEQVKKNPKNIALVTSDGRLTYEELYKKSDRLAKYLQYKGIITNSIVGLLFNQSFDMIVSVLGVLKAGAAYLPIDPETPESRLNYILKDSCCNIVLTHKQIDFEFNNKTIFIDIESIVNDDEIDIRKFVRQKFASAYLIYTSGTTGKPKGVLLSHKNLINYSSWFSDLAKIQPTDKTALVTSYSFDLGYTGIYSSLLNGGQLHLLPKSIYLSPDRLNKYIALNEISYLKLTPSLYALLVDEENFEEAVNKLRLVVLGGEKINVEAVEETFRINNNIRVLNHYGPTEATIGCVFHEIEKEDFAKFAERPVIGRPISNIKTYILNNEGGMQPLGVSGELCISGEGLAGGYINNPELTKDKFTLNPFDQGTYLYKTGDLAKKLDDGIIEFLGRTDHQVKIKGYRIELGEIENCILKYTSVKECIVFPYELEEGENVLRAYIVTSERSNEILMDLQSYLTHQLPYYMIPAQIMQIEKIPLTPNGKVNFKELPNYDGKKDQVFVCPQNSIEQNILEIWKEVLNLDRISILDNYIMLGGDSIKSIQIVSKCLNAGYNISVQDVFICQNIRELALIAKNNVAQISQKTVIGTAPLSPIQKYHFSVDGRNIHYYNHALALNFNEKVEIEIIKDIFEVIGKHHDVLRATFRLEEKEVVQEIKERGFEVYIKEFDFTRIENSRKKTEEINKLQSSINLEKGPLLKLVLFQYREYSELVIIIHHLVIDGISWRILFEDINTLYGQSINNEPYKLPPKTHSFNEWSVKLQEYCQSEKFNKTIKYWANILNQPTDEIKRDFHDGTSNYEDNISESFRLDEQLTESLLKETNQAYNTQINDILLSALIMSMNDIFGTQKIKIDIEGHGREGVIGDMNVSRTVGWFTSIYPVVLSLADDEGIASIIKNIKETTNKVPNNGIDYLIYKYLCPGKYYNNVERDYPGNIGFNYLGQFDSDIKGKYFEVDDTFGGDSIDPKSKTVYDINIVGLVKNNKLEVSLYYSEKQYKGETLQKLSERFKGNLEEIIKHCASRNEPETTPSDYQYKDLSFEELDWLKRKYDFSKIYTLSPMQEGMLYHYILNSNSTSYLEQFECDVEGVLDIPTLQKSINALISEIEILRTVFISSLGKRNVQVVLNKREIKINYIDVRQAKNNSELNEIVEKDRKLQFNLAEDILLRITVIKTSEYKYKVLYTYHHILTDGWCSGILISQLFSNYAAYISNKEPKQLNIKQYSEYIEWIDQKEKKESYAYWEKHLKAYKQLTTIPFEKEETDSYLLTKEYLTLDSKLMAMMKTVSEKLSITPNTIIQAAWGIFLSKINSTNDVVFGSVVSGRPPELKGSEQMIGLFMNSIPVRIKCDANSKIKDILTETQTFFIQSEPYHYISLAEIQSRSELKNNLYDHYIAFENYPSAESLGKATNNEKIETDYKIKEVKIHAHTNFDFGLCVIPNKNILIEFKYNSKAYKREHISLIASEYELLLKEILLDQKKEVHKIESGRVIEKMLITEQKENATGRTQEENEVLSSWLD